MKIWVLAQAPRDEYTSPEIYTSIHLSYDDAVAALLTNYAESMEREGLETLDDVIQFWGGDMDPWTIDEHEVIR